MPDPSPDATLPIDLQNHVAKWENDFRRAWIAGRNPSMEEYLANVPPNVRPELVRALLSVELDLRRNSAGQQPTELEFFSIHPELVAELKQAFHELRVLGSGRAGANAATIMMPVASSDRAVTIDHTPSRPDSRGLHIRCPHCSNPVELLADTPYDDISCKTCGSTFSLVERGEDTRMSAPLKSIGRFDLVARLGVGGFGTVWKARDRELDRVVAVKIPRRGQLSGAEIEQFYREARSAAQLRHPNIVPVHEVGRDGETLFIVSDLVRGVSLTDWLTGHRPTPLEVAEMCATICDALHHAHQQGVIHRDMKPSNLMIDQEGQPHLMDFGLAKREVGEVTMTVEGQILGTPAYMSPEQAGGETRWVDRRTDIYSMGVILFEMLAGELPFRGNHQMQIHARLTEDPPDPRTLNSHIPRDLSTICLKCMEREPGRRYSTAAELKEEFERFTNGEPILARPLSRPARAIRWAKRKPLIATIIGLVTFMAIAGPITAAVIATQKNRLAELVDEKDGLIKQGIDEKQKDANKIAQLSADLRMWEGKSNPWEFWPPKRNDSPRQTLIGAALQHSSGALGKGLASESITGDDAVRGYLTLAMLADAQNLASDATQYYDQARDRLETLRQSQPNDIAIAGALADCHANLARLVEKTDRAVAVQHLESARALREQLAKDNLGDLQFQIAHLEAELNCAAMLDFDAAREHLQRAGDLAKSLTAKFPNGPVELYRLAAFLTEHEATLGAQ